MNLPLPIPIHPSKKTQEQHKLFEAEIKTLPELVKAKYTLWKDGARPFQLECMTAQLRGQDVILHAATGAGKTGIAAGPHLLTSSIGKVTLMVSPLLSLQDEQVQTFKDEFGLEAIAINSSNGGCHQEILHDIVRGKWQIVLLSPEMLLSRRFIDNVLRKSEFVSRCLSIFIDEAHCISHWGSSFRKKYGTIGVVRAFLRRDTPLIAVSATLTPRVRNDLVTKLQFNPQTYLYINKGNDRPNVAQVVRSMEHAMGSYRDLDFLVPENMTSPLDMNKTFIYTDDVKGGADLTDYLNSRITKSLRMHGLVRPYNAAMSSKYRKNVMRLFKLGIVRVLVCTDAAGMGCNIPDVDMVVQWKAPASVSTWIQRAGRAARAPGRTGLAVMIVEKSAFEINISSTETQVVGLDRSTQSQSGRRGLRSSRGGRGRASRGLKSSSAQYGVLHGLKRGMRNGKTDNITPIDGPEEIPIEATGEGLHFYIQATSCRRTVLTKIFGNAVSSVPKVKCCDVCNPKLFDATRPGKSPVTARQRKIKKGLPDHTVRKALYAWRSSVKQISYPHALWGAQAILDDDTCEILASIGPVTSKDQLALVLKDGWARWNLLGESLYGMMSKLNIPSLIPVGRKPRAGLKRTAPTDTIEADCAAVSEVSKRARKSVAPVTERTQSVHLQLQNVSVQAPDKSVPTLTMGTSQRTAAAFPSSGYDSFFANLRRT